MSTPRLAQCGGAGASIRPASPLPAAMVELSSSSCGRALDIPAVQAGVAEFVAARTLAQFRVLSRRFASTSAGALGLLAVCIRDCRDCGFEQRA